MKLRCVSFHKQFVAVKSLVGYPIRNNCINTLFSDASPSSIRDFCDVFTRSEARCFSWIRFNLKVISVKATALLVFCSWLRPCKLFDNCFGHCFSLAENWIHCSTPFLYFNHRKNRRNVKENCKANMQNPGNTDSLHDVPHQTDARELHQVASNRWMYKL